MYNDQEQMMDDQILCDFLDNAVLKAKERIRLEGRIETEDAIPLMLKSQFNHIAHLETQMATKTEIAAIKEQISFIQWLILFGFALIACLQVYTTFIK